MNRLFIPPWFIETAGLIKVENDKELFDEAVNKIVITRTKGKSKK
jgi:hypothetical protein